MAGRLRAHDWASTPLGPINCWPLSLRIVVDLMLGCPEPVSVLWGAACIQLYNDAYIPIAAGRHPTILGRPVQENWPEIWDEILHPVIERVLVGESVVLDDQRVLLRRSDGTEIEERIFTASFSPIRDEQEAVAGIFLPLIETTGQYRAERIRETEVRHGFLLKLSDRLRPLADIAEIQKVATRTLGKELRACRVNYVEIRDNMAIVTCEYAADVPSLVGEHRLTLFGEDMRERLATGRPDVVEDTLADPGLTPNQRAAYLALCNHAHVAAPILEGGRPVAFMVVQDRVPRRWTAAEIALVEEATERTWVAIERAKAQAASPRTGDRFRRALEATTAGVVFYNRAGIIIDANDAFLRMTGFGRDDRAAGLIRYDEISPEWHRKNSQALAEKATGESQPFEKECLRKDGTRIWILCTNNQLADGVTVEFAVDITDRKHAEQQLHEREARLAALFACAAVGLSEIAPDGRFLRVNDEVCRILGRSREQLLRMDISEVTYPDDVAPSVELVANVVRTGRTASIDKRYRRPDGSLVFATSTASRLAVTVGGLSTWDWNLRTDEIAWSDEHYAIQGYAMGEVLPSFQAWLDRVHPDDRAGVLAAIKRARDTRQDYVHGYRILHPDGTVRWCLARGRFFHDENGEPVRMIGVMDDVTQQRSWNETQKVLIAELQHRTRNLIGVVRSIADRTLANTSSLEEFRECFHDRLGALGRVQGLLSRQEAGQRVTFDELVRAELAGIGVIDGDVEHPQVALSGPKGVRLRPGMVQTLALGLHELATNAVKYGALSSGSGRLHIHWKVQSRQDGRPELRVRWRETGAEVPRAKDAERQGGYGRELIERALPYQLEAQTRYELGKDGVDCSIVVPLVRE